VSTELRPGLLDDLGLAAAIEWQVEEFAERTGIRCDLHLSEEDVRLESGVATALFRILQETLTNVARHAGANEVQVELAVDPREVVLKVRDDGRGITESEISSTQALGLLGMRERARTLGGEVTFEGVRGQGTTVTVRIPYDLTRMTRMDESEA
jgi:signal transduction histidine kinase